MDAEIHDERTDHAIGQYTLLSHGQVAGELTWRLTGGRRAITHTGVRPAFRGQGLAGLLVARALDDARSEGVQVVPSCSYAARYIDEHPDYADLVATGP